MKIPSLLLLLVPLLVTTTGCAFASVDIHPPAATDLPPRSASTPGRGREVILVGPFGDSRPEDRCGAQKNGYGSDTADVHCEVIPGRWVADALAMELERIGFRVLRGDAEQGRSSIVVRGVVSKLYLEPVDSVFTRSVEGDIAASLLVTSPSGLRAERTFYGKGESESIASTEGVFQAAADDATHEIARKMAVALVRLLDRFPELGQPEPSERPS